MDGKNNLNIKTFHFEQSENDQSINNKSEDTRQQNSEEESETTNASIVNIIDQGEEIEMNGIKNINTKSTGQNQRMVDADLLEQNKQETNTMNDIQADLGPIIGYADEPLLPLTEACAPLVDIIHDIMFYVQMALTETSSKPPDQLTIDESAAIRLYTIEWSKGHRSLYSMLNYTLKNDTRENLRPYLKYLKLFLTALVKLPCVPSLTLWRGVTKNLSADFPPGTQVTW
ncbi:unnamed protein product [Adineta ricciae]|uniref:Uncharacterized protein n=1 Tax=Adineta ricciae TaxID=249248 RepID=A0A815PLX1_ADIRI|nr:unnamed protein product [Adineta ricciae]